MPNNLQAEIERLSKELAAAKQEQLLQGLHIGTIVENRLGAKSIVLADPKNNSTFYLATFPELYPETLSKSREFWIEHFRQYGFTVLGKVEFKT